MTPDAQALAPVLARLNHPAGGEDLWLSDATVTLEWVAANLYADGEVGAALRARLRLSWVRESFGHSSTVRRRLYGTEVSS